jgi:hypothetical protein
MVRLALDPLPGRNRGWEGNWLGQALMNRLREKFVKNVLFLGGNLQRKAPGLGGRR